MRDLKYREDEARAVEERAPSCDERRAREDAGGQG